MHLLLCYAVFDLFDGPSVFKFELIMTYRLNINTKD